MKEQVEGLFFDPIAEDSEALFDPQKAHQAMWRRYAAGDVEHDYTADKFVADTEALMLDAQFVGQFEQAQAIAERMHVLCGEDHGLHESMAASGFFDHQHDAHEGHNHHGKDDEKKSKKAKKKKFRGWFDLARA